jgi:uncharacterized membrane protein YbhN (UPF0104 family)
MTDPASPVTPTGPPAPDEDDEGAGRRGRSRSRTAALVGLVGLLVGGAAVAFVVATLVDRWSEVSEEIRHAEVGWLVAAATLAALGMVTIAWGWRHVLALLGVRAPAPRVVGWYFAGEIGKYVPGGVWPVLGRGEIARRHGVPRTRAYASVALSLMVLYLAAMFVAVALLPFALSEEGFSPWMLCLLALPLGLALLHHSVLERMVALVERLTGRRVGIDVPRWDESLLLVARYVPAWFFIGTATWCVARALDPGASFARVCFAAVLSWIAGFLAVPVPGGAGVREAVLYASSGLSKAEAVTVAVAARLLFVVVDVVGALAGAPSVGRRREGVSVGPRPEATPADR